MAQSQGKKQTTQPKGKPTPSRKSTESRPIRASTRLVPLQWIGFAALLIAIIVLAIIFGPEGSGGRTGVGHN